MEWAAQIVSYRFLWPVGLGTFAVEPKTPKGATVLLLEALL